MSDTTLAQYVQFLMRYQDDIALAVQVTGNPNDLSQDDLSSLRDRKVVELIIVLADS